MIHALEPIYVFVKSGRKLYLRISLSAVRGWGIVVKITQQSLEK